MQCESTVATGAPWGEGEAGLQPPPPSKIKTNTHFVDMMISKVLHNLCFSLNKEVESADDKKIRILKINNLKNM